LWVTNGLVHYFLNFDTTKNSWVRNETFWMLVTCRSSKFALKYVI
jgi:hypothetical protein